MGDHEDQRSGIDRRTSAPLTDDDIRGRFHDISTKCDASILKATLLETALTTLSQKVDQKANSETIEAGLKSFTQKLDHLREDFGLVRNVVFGLIALIVTSVILALVTGALRPPA